jgi:hypothetical protein
MLSSRNHASTVCCRCSFRWSSTVNHFGTSRDDAVERFRIGLRQLL